MNFILCNVINLDAVNPYLHICKNESTQYFKDHIFVGLVFYLGTKGLQSLQPQDF